MIMGKVCEDFRHAIITVDSASNGPGNLKLEIHATLFRHNRLFSGHVQRLNEETKPEEDRGQEGDTYMIRPRVGKETHRNTPAAFKRGKQGISPAPPFSPSPKALPPAYDTKPLETRKSIETKMPIYAIGLRLRRIQAPAERTTFSAGAC